MRLRWWPRYEALGIAPEVMLITRRRRIGIRMGRSRWKCFSERYQGQHGIPIQWRYFFGGRITLHTDRNV